MTNTAKKTTDITGAPLLETSHLQVVAKPEPETELRPKTVTISLRIGAGDVAKLDELAALLREKNGIGAGRSAVIREAVRFAYDTLKKRYQSDGQ